MHAIDAHNTWPIGHKVKSHHYETSGEYSQSQAREGTMEIFVDMHSSINVSKIVTELLLSFWNNGLVINGIMPYPF